MSIFSVNFSIFNLDEALKKEKNKEIQSKNHFRSLRLKNSKNIVRNAISMIKEAFK